MTTVILGTGIIGASTAFYLSQSQTPSTIHLVEPSPELFASASGYAGGFLAKDWFSSSIAELGALSFAEHKRLAEVNNGREKWGYSRSTGTSYTAAREKGKQGKRGDDWLRAGSSRAGAAAEGVTDFVDKGGEPRWLKRDDGDSVEIISEVGSTAQVDPLRLSQFLLSQCLGRGVQLHHPAKAVSIAKDMHDEFFCIRIADTNSRTETDIPCTRLVIAAGAWSSKVFKTLFPKSDFVIPITSLAGHSLVVRSPRWTKELEDSGCHAVFITDEAGFSPEIFSRMGGEIYVAGLNDASIPLPELATDSKISEESIARLKTISKILLGSTGNVDDLVVVRKGLCFRPVTAKGTPILARIPDERLGGMKTRGGAEGGVWLAAGHGPWGISMSLGTGKVMAEMIQGLKTTVDVKDLGF